MRLSAAVDSAAGLTPDCHLCWGYRDRSEFRTAAREFIADGIASSQWVEFVGGDSIEQSLEELYALGLEQAVEEGDVGCSSVWDFYRSSGKSGVVDPAASVAARISAAQDVLAAGYKGFRAVVDASAVVRTVQQREAFARYEHLLDRKMSNQLISAMCGYDLDELGPRKVAELACLHPVASDGVTPFRLYADPGVDLALAGEIDLTCRELLVLALDRVLPLSSAGSELVVDAEDLTFIDHRGLLAMDDHVAANNRRVVLRSHSSVLADVADLLPLSALRVERVAEPLR